MNQIPVSQQRELKWKLKDGSLIPIKELNNNQLQHFRKITVKKINEFYRNYEFFSEMLECMDDELQDRISKVKENIELLQIQQKKLKQLQEIEKEV